MFKIYRGLVKDGACDPAAKDEAGPTWTGVFPKGKIGIMPRPSTTLGLMPADMDIGVAPIPGPDGGESTFVGGDVLGISATSRTPTRRGTSCPGRVGDEAQVEIVAKNKDIAGRTDLADNKYAAEDPRLVLINGLVAKGETPYTLKFGETYNDPTGPWLKIARDAVFGRRHRQALTAGKDALSGALGPVVTTGGAVDPASAPAQPPRLPRRSQRASAASRASATRRRRRSSSRVFFLVPLVLVFWMSLNDWPLLGTPTLNAPENYTDIPDNQLFLDAVVFTLKYTAIITVVLSAVAFGLALLVQSRRRGVGFLRTAYFLPGVVGLAAASLLFHGFYSKSGPLDTLLINLGILNEPITGSSTPNSGAVSHDRDGDLALRRLQHADPADRPAGDPGRRLRGRAVDGAAAGTSATSRCRCCARRSR